MSISFFTRNGDIGTRGKAGSNVIRGKQIADYLGAKLNPKEGFENDICIFVKMLPEVYPKNSYLDIIDGKNCVDWLFNHLDLKAIVCTKSIHKFLIKKLSRDVIYIPQHHCNYDRIVRDRNKIVTVGVIGRSDSEFKPIEELKSKLKKLGINYQLKCSYIGKDDIVDFYKNIDVQIIGKRRRHWMKNPLKIINACSFGIPTLAVPEDNYLDMKEYYIPVQTVNDVINEIKKLQNGWDANRLIEKAEEYHIENISKLYKKL